MKTYVVIEMYKKHGLERSHGFKNHLEAINYFNYLKAKQKRRADYYDYLGYGLTWFEI